MCDQALGKEIAQRASCFHTIAILALQPKYRRIASGTIVDKNGIVLTDRFVVLLQFIAKPSRLAANNGVHTRMVGWLAIKTSVPIRYSFRVST